MFIALLNVRLKFSGFGDAFLYRCRKGFVFLVNWLEYYGGHFIKKITYKLFRIKEAPFGGSLF
ncbi:hypothetical protein C2L80_12340 [Rubneribacter badeniensis]|uniref:Uncharacterized protein n=1 Tax=Rubneribacter badeniensis TaxID=2070688 RepID=A0A2K2U275_9ACTN|nr:hypothetical protein B5F41_13525 [Gordonibacter sp. An232A]PNV64364.1 hypothetical protein C2L80_12340 [Rubneribacter badeniensis]